MTTTSSDMTCHVATNHSSSPHVTSQPTTLLHLTPQAISWLQDRSHHHHGTAEGSFTAKKWFGHRAGRSPCAHSIGKFFLYSSFFVWNFRPRLARELLVTSYISWHWMMEMCGAASDWKNIPHSTKGVICRGKPFRNIKQTSRFESQFNACSIMMHEIQWVQCCRNLTQIAACILHPRATNVLQSSSHLNEPEGLAKHGKENLHELESWRVWPESLAKKLVKNILTSFLLLAKS